MLGLVLFLSGQYDEAVELLEGGRAVFWSQVSQLRTPVNALRNVASEFFKNLGRIFFELEQGCVC